MKLRKILASVVAVAMVASVAISASAASKVLAGEPSNTKEITYTGAMAVSSGSATISADAVNYDLGIDVQAKIKEVRINNVLPDSSGNWTITSGGFSAAGTIVVASGTNLNAQVRVVFEAVTGEDDFGQIVEKDDLDDTTLKLTAAPGGAVEVGLTPSSVKAETGKIGTDIFGGFSTSELVSIARAGGATLEIGVTGHNDQTIALRQDGKTVSIEVIKDNKATLTVPASVFAETWDGGAAPNRDNVDIRINGAAATVNTATLSWGPADEPGAGEAEEEGGETEGEGEEGWDDGEGDLVPGEEVPGNDFGGEGGETGGEDTTYGSFGSLEELNAYLAANNITPAMGATALINGVVYTWNGTAWAAGGTNPPTGVALAIVPALIAGAAVAVARKRK
ncbi:MAG: hypothetical protein FWH08_01035 [Oscillospiraceae bacterium]|nr:hypothetical protein [Oscillospiraceae bacterium]